MRPILLLLASLTIVAGAHAGALDAPLIWDDLQLVASSSVEQLHSPWHYLMSPFLDLREHTANATIFYRPLVVFSLAMDVAMHGRNPTGFHLANLLMHLGNVSLVFLLARRLGANALAAAAGSLGWGLLPRLAESVSWVSGRTDLLAAMGVLGGLLVWRKGHLGRLVLSSAIVFAGMLAKEMAVSGAMALAVAELWPRPKPRIRWLGLIPLAFALSYLALRFNVMGVVVGSNALPLTATARIGTVLEALGRYTWMSLDVWHPQTQIGVVGRLAWPYCVLGVCALGLAVVLLWRHLRELDALEVATLCAGVVPVWLVSHALPMPWLVVACDRLMYLPWAVVAAAVASQWSRFRARLLITSLAAVGYLIGVSGAALVLMKRVATFADEAEFWTDAVETTAAANWGPSLEVSALYERAGLYVESQRVLELLDGREPYPGTADLPFRLARAMARRGQYQQALALAGANLTTAPSPKHWLDSARLALHVLDLDSADRFAEGAERALPGYRSARELRATIARVRELRRIVEQPTASGIEQGVNRARIAMLAGRGSEAESAWLTLLEDRRLSEQDADEGFAYLAELGTKAALAQAIAAYATRPHAREELLLGAQERLRFAEHLLDNWPRVERALQRLRSRPEARG